MQDKDALAKYICDRVAATLTRYGRKVKRTGEHALVVTDKSPLYEWRVVVRRTGKIDFEAMDSFAAKHPIPNLAEHVSDALADEYEFTVSEDKANNRVVMQPRALPNAPLALPAAE